LSGTITVLPIDAYHFPWNPRVNNARIEDAELIAALKNPA